jgi:multiple antibiotic resistance protein
MKTILITSIYHIFLASIPILVAIDIFGILPIYIDFVKDSDDIEEKHIRKNSLITAFTVGLGFLFLGKLVFLIMGISIYDFEIAGGILLFIISIKNLISEKEGLKKSLNNADLGVVPIGVPLIVGPGVLTTLLILVGVYGYIIVTIAFFINILIVYFVLKNTRILIKILGKKGSNAAGKIAALLLAAYAIMMVRKGIANTILHYLRIIR